MPEDLWLERIPVLSIVFYTLRWVTAKLLLFLLVGFTLDGLLLDFRSFSVYYGPASHILWKSYSLRKIINTN